MELVSLSSMSKESKLLLLNELGYASDETYVIDRKGNKVIDKYIDQPVKVDNMLILPGSTIIIDNNHLSIAAYLEEYGDDAI